MPNAIEAETSSTSQVVIARSGTCRRTCGIAGARAGRGVEPAHVVAGLVGPQLRELGAGAEAGASVLAGQDAGRAPAQREVEPRDRVAGQRAPGPGGPGGTMSCGGAHAASASGALPGGATTSSTRSSRSSGCTPSASAS